MNRSKNELSYSVNISIPRETYKKIQDLMPNNMTISEQIEALLNEKLQELERTKN